MCGVEEGEVGTEAAVGAVVSFLAPASSESLHMEVLEVESQPEN